MALHSSSVPALPLACPCGWQGTLADAAKPNEVARCPKCAALLDRGYKTREMRPGGGQTYKTKEGDHD